MIWRACTVAAGYFPIKHQLDHQLKLNDDHFWSSKRSKSKLVNLLEVKMLQVTVLLELYTVQCLQKSRSPWQVWCLGKRWYKEVYESLIKAFSLRLCPNACLCLSYWRNTNLCVYPIWVGWRGLHTLSVKMLSW
mgnify:CR=1 FL=1